MITGFIGAGFTLAQVPSRSSDPRAPAGRQFRWRHSSKPTSAPTCRSSSICARHPGVRLGLHYSGPLLEWFEQRHPEFLDTCGNSSRAARWRWSAAAFTSRSWSPFRPRIRLEQIPAMREYLQRKFGRAPAGAWLAERVWEPQLPYALASAGVQYTLVDDVHFLAAGFETRPASRRLCLRGSRPEPCGCCPASRRCVICCRFVRPKRPSLFCARAPQRHPGGMAAMGDDCEKFGAWPGTYDHCYRDGWVERFFAALEASADWLATTPPGEYIAAHPPLGRADLPTASYSEMMEWVLPTAARNEFHAVSAGVCQPAGRAAVPARRALARRSSPSIPNRICCTRKCCTFPGSFAAWIEAIGQRQARQARAAPERILLRAQCNDAYWHGVFGGLYAPHLRTELWRELVRAETLAERSAARASDGLHIERRDFDADGSEELYVTSPRLAALVRPADGGTIGALDFRTSARHADQFHAAARRGLSQPLARSLVRASGGQVASIHDQVRAKEERLERFLRYDRWPRNAFRLLLFPAGQDVQGLSGTEARRKCRPGRRRLRRPGDTAPTASAWSAKSAARIARAPDGPVELLRCTKHFSFALGKRGLSGRLRLRAFLRHRGSPLRVLVGMEMVLNFLAPHEPDRYFEVPSGRHPLRWAAACSAAEIRFAVADGRRMAECRRDDRSAWRADSGLRRSRPFRNRRRDSSASTRARKFCGVARGAARGRRVARRHKSARVEAARTTPRSATRVRE